MRKPINDLATVIPGVGTAVNKLVNFIDNLTGVKAVSSIRASINGPGNLVVNGPVTVTSTVGFEKNPKDDAIVLNDGLVSFNPNDTIYKMSDGLVAGTSIGGNVGSLKQLISNTSQPPPTAQEIASAVADAIAGIQIVTRIDDINEAQARNNYNINAVT